MKKIGTKTSGTNKKKNMETGKFNSIQFTVLT